MACAFFLLTLKTKSTIDEIVRVQRLQGIVHREPPPPTLDCIIGDAVLNGYINFCVFLDKYVMRKEFILILLGIICVSTLSSLLSGFVPIETEKVLLDTVVGKVGAGNFTYWQLGHSGPLLVELTSLKGDADLYVADNIRPSFEVDRNNFSSVTCGSDLVSIPEDFPRPVGIGVFGYWSHQVSEYSIQVFMDTSSIDRAQLQTLVHRVAERNELDKKKESSMSRKADDDKPRFMKILNAIDMVFEMFVL